ncbi:MAG: hypothetical protein IMX00_09970 [Limnochordales bacterium]|nr:hypothetical protein [Limnochordales bacterium]
MIIRIATEGQYELTGAALARLDEIDNELLAAISANDAQAYQERFRDVLELIRKEGRPLAAGELRESDLVLPPPDTTLEEAKALFAEYPADLPR